MSAAGMGGSAQTADHGGAPSARLPPQIRSPMPPLLFLPPARRLLERLTQGVRAALAESQVVRALSEGLVGVIRASTHQDAGGRAGAGEGEGAGAGIGPLTELTAALLEQAERAIEEERPRAKEEARPRAKAGARR